MFRACSACSTTIERKDCHKNRYSEYICRKCHATGIKFTSEGQRRYVMRRARPVILLRLAIAGMALLAISTSLFRFFSTGERASLSTLQLELVSTRTRSRQPSHRSERSPGSLRPNSPARALQAGPAWPHECNPSCVLHRSSEWRHNRRWRPRSGPRRGHIWRAAWCSGARRFWWPP